MKRIFFTICIIAVILVSCSESKKQAESTAVQPQEQTSLPVDKVDKTCNFFGHSINLNDSTMSQIKDICEQEKNLKFYTNTSGIKVINIVGTEFAINIKKKDIALISSKQPESKDIKKVASFITKIYGKPTEKDEEGYLWTSIFSKNDKKEDFYVRMSRVHTDEGGTVIIIR